MSSFVPANTTQDITVAAGSLIALGSFGAGTAVVYQSTAPSLLPTQFISVARFSNDEVLLGPWAADTLLRVDASHSQVEYNIGEAPVVGVKELIVDYSGTGSSFQVVPADLILAEGAGSDDGTDPAFLAAMMGNVISDDPVTGEGNYLAGVIGAYSLAGSDSDYPKAAVMGVLMDGAADADAIVMAVVDGSDPSATTHARAAFGVAQLNNSGDSGVDYGVDLKADGSAHYTGTGDPFTVDKAQIRFSLGDVCILAGEGAPVNGTTGDNFAGKGSLYIDITNGDVYVNKDGTITAPAWNLLAFAV